MLLARDFLDDQFCESFSGFDFCHHSGWVKSSASQTLSDLENRFPATLYLPNLIWKNTT